MGSECLSEDDVFVMSSNHLDHLKGYLLKVAEGGVNKNFSWDKCDDEQLEEEEAMSDWQEDSPVTSEEDEEQAKNESEADKDSSFLNEVKTKDDSVRDEKRTAQSLSDEPKNNGAT